MAALAIAACESSESDRGDVPDSGSATPFEAGGGGPADAPGTDASSPKDAGADVDGNADAGKILPEGLSEPVPYLSRAGSPFNGVVFPAYLHFEDWEDGAANTPGLTSSSADDGAGPLVDSIDGDDGVIDGQCVKAVGTCHSGFSLSGTIELTFDAVALGTLPSHVGVAWTDGSTGCDAIFEAYDAANVLIGTKTAAAVGDGSNAGTVAEDRFFSVVHAAGVKRIVVKSSGGGVEVDHLQYGR